MTRARDIGVAVVAVTAACIALQGIPDVDIQLRWMIGEQATSGTEHQRMHPIPIPQPLVTDLDGDGKSEVVVLSDDRMTIRVLSIPPASGETLVDPVILYQSNIAPSKHAPRERHAVAIAAGCLDPPQRQSGGMSGGGSGSGGTRRQHVVVVREDWNVICYNHKLERVWKRSLPHMGSPGEGGSFVIDQVAIVVTHAAPTVDDQGRPNREATAGSVVVGASLRHRDGHHHTRAALGTADASLGDVNPLGVHVEAFVEGEEDSRDEEEEAKMTEEEKQRRAAEHFSMFRLDGASGDVIWSHEAWAHQKEQDELAETGAVRRPHYKLEELDDLSRPVDDQAGLSSGGGGGRRYRRSLLHLLPHAWSSPVDTRLEVAELHRRGPSGRVAGGDATRTSFSGRRKLPAAETVDDVGRGRTGAGGVGGVVRAVIARTREGLEAVELLTGKPLSSVALPVTATSGAGGAYADLNGDGVVDHVQAVGTRGMEGWGHLHSGLAMGHLSAQASPPDDRKGRRLPPCYALAVSGLPPREQLFNGSICHDGGAVFEMGERLSKPNSRLAPNSDVEVGASAPAVLSRRVSTASAKYPGQPGTATGLSRRQSRLDVVFAVSTGVVSCYDDEGRLKWQDRHGPKWWFPPGGMAAKEGENDDVVRGYVVPFRLEDSAGGDTGDPFLAQERILVVGSDKICVYDREGRLSGQAPLVSAPSQPPVIGDFDGNGIADVVILGRGGLVAGYTLAPDPGIRALFVAVLVLIGAMLVVAAVYVPPPASSARGFGQGWGRPRGVWKSKRATD
ncbi:unnamed protein product [Ascophyllum nodosum]